MGTFVGDQELLSEAFKALTELEYDAREAYEAAINRLENQTFKDKMIEFKNDHQNHINELDKLLRAHNVEVPTGADAKALLTQGKVVLANLVGDKAILQAMSSNEKDTNAAYTKMLARKDNDWKESVAFLQKALKDEQNHATWLKANTK